MNIHKKNPATYYLLPTHSFRSRAGLSIIELLVFSAIFTFVILAFITVLVTVVNINTRQAGAAEVNQQSQYLLQQLKYYVERSSLIELPQDASTTTLRLRMKATSEDPTIFTLSGGRVYIQKGGGSNDPLTSAKVNVFNLSFVKHSNPPAHDSVDIAFTTEYVTDSLRHKFVQSLRTAIARVSAATFDSNVSPSSTDSNVIGTGALRWSSINGAIYFSAANPPNVGISDSSFTPAARLQVKNGDIYIDTAGKALIIKDPSTGYCWWYRPTTATGAWNISSSTCP